MVSNCKAHNNIPPQWRTFSNYLTRQINRLVFVGTSTFFTGYERTLKQRSRPDFLGTLRHPFLDYVLLLWTSFARVRGGQSSVGVPSFPAYIFFRPGAVISSSCICLHSDCIWVELALHRALRTAVIFFLISTAESLLEMWRT